MTEPREFANLIGGEPRPAYDGRLLDSLNPATGEVWARVPASGPDDVAAAVAAARTAFPAWAALPAAGRARHLRGVADVIARHAAELAEIETRDNGRVITETAGTDLPGAAYLWGAAAAASADAVRGDTVILGPDCLGLTRRVPYGVVAGVIPWNAPISTFSAKAAHALAAGNTVVVKPAEQASASVLRLGELLADALPPGAVNIVSGRGEDAGDALVRHPGVDRVSLTGSTQTARLITRGSADALKQLAFELGGKSPNIVFPDADLDAAARGVSVESVFTGNAGQVCVAGSRVLVHRSVFDEVIERVRRIVAGIALGDPLDPATGMGPIVSAEQYARVTGYLKLADDSGAHRVFGGRHGADLFPPGSPFHGGYWVEPTLYTTEDPALRICREEIFGPVAVAIPFDTDDDAVRIANDSPYGLAAGVWTRDLHRAHRMLRDLESGLIWINTYRQIPPGLPFEGTKSSGYGHDAVLANTREKTCVIETGGP